MPNIDNAANFLILQGNTAGTNGVIQVVGSNTILSLGVSNTANVNNLYITLPQGIVQNMGSCNANSTGTIVTLAHPYTTAIYSVGADSNTVASSIGITTANTTAITITSNTTANVICYWQCWGY